MDQYQIRSLEDIKICKIVKVNPKLNTELLCTKSYSIRTREHWNQAFRSVILDREMKTSLREQ